MGRGSRVGVRGLVLACAIFATSVPVAGAKAIKGKLSEPGYAVIALNPDGTMTSADVDKGPFRLRTAVPKVTLHLRGHDGKYAGPIVVGGGGKRAVVGVRSGASLGDVVVREGYAEVEGKLSKRSLDRSRTARARNGVPLGAGVFGRVRSSTPRHAAPGDPDLDGIPNSLDIDDDGDLILDGLDRSKKRRSELRTTTEVDIECGPELTLDARLAQTRNANAPGVAGDPAEIDALLASRGSLIIGCGVQESATGNPVPGGTWRLDCSQPQRRTDPTLGGLVYCTMGGTGRVPPRGPQPWPPRDTWSHFPDNFDPDPNGDGNLEGAEPLFHGAGSTQIGTGDTIFGRFIKNGAETRVPIELQYVPATTQALVSYDDGQGNAPMVQYPVSEIGPGTPGNPFPVFARPGSDDVVLTFTFWRPQRRPIGDDEHREACLDEDPPCEWVDIGGLRHTVGLGQSDHRTRCLADSYSTSDTRLDIYRDPPPDPEDEDAIEGAGGILDKALDQRASAGNTFTYTVNFTECLRSDAAWAIGETKELSFVSSEGSGGEAFGSAAVQSVYFTRQAPP